MTLFDKDQQELEALRAMLSRLNEQIAQQKKRIQDFQRLVRAMDLQAERITKLEGDEWVVVGYKWNTGLWHRLLGMLLDGNLEK